MLASFLRDTRMASATPILGLLALCLLFGAAPQARSAIDGPRIASLILIEPNADKLLQTLQNGARLDLTELEISRLNVLATVSGAIPTQSVRFELLGPKNLNRVESAAPFALFGDKQGDLRPGYLPLGQYSLKVTPYSERHANGVAGQSVELDFEVVKGAGDIHVSALFLVDATTGRDIKKLEDGAQFDLTALATDQLTIRAEVGGETETGSVRLAMSGAKNRVYNDNTAPFALFGGLSGARFSEGEYQLIATPFIERGSKGASGAPLSTSFSIVRGAGDIRIETLFLVDAVTNRDIKVLEPGATIDLTALENESLSIRATTGGDSPTASVVWQLSGSRQNRYADNTAPYGAFSDQAGDFRGRKFNPGDYVIEATPHILRGGKGAAGAGVKVPFSVVRRAGDIALTDFILVDAASDTDLMPLTSNSVVDLTTIGASTFNIRAVTAGQTQTASVRFELEGPRTRSRADSETPFSMFGDKNGNFSGTKLPEGDYVIKASPHIERGGRGDAGAGLNIAFKVVKSAGDMRVQQLLLIDPSSGNEIASLRNGSVIDLNGLDEEKLNIRADIAGDTTVASVEFQLTGPLNIERAENDAPYALFGDRNGTLRSGRLGVGQYQLRATPHIERNGGGNAGVPMSVAFSVVRGDVDGSSSLLDAQPSPHGISVAQAVRFLTQATFGPSKESIHELRSIGYEAWLTRQQLLSPSLHLPYLDAYLTASGKRGMAKNKRMEAWFHHAAQAEDQLCQRVAFALSEIFVVSDRDPNLSRSEHAFGLAQYYDILVRHCFGSFRSLLEQVTLSPVMGTFLTSVNNKKPDELTGAMPDENYAREVKQLFSIGLCELDEDGTAILEPDGECVATYDQPDIEAAARILTGWTFDQASSQAYGAYGRRGSQFIAPMVLNPQDHDDEEKVVLGELLPAGQGGEADLSAYLDLLFEHPNVGPFIAMRLIQRLVTSNPSSQYVARVARTFDDNGRGERGDLGAVIQAILLNPEAREPAFAGQPDFGKVREPILLPLALWRGLSAGPQAGESYRYPRPEEDFAQAPLRAPSVFNFFQPTYQHPGEIMDLGLYSPELQIINETTILATTNSLHNWIYFRRGRELYDIEEEIGITEASCERLVEHLGLLFNAGRTSDHLRIAVSRIACDSAIRASDRTRDSIYLMLSSPEFSVQR